MYADLPRVKTWYEVDGEGDPIVLLHGGLVTNDTWAMQRGDLAAGHKLFLPERRAHGHTPDVEGPISYADMAADTIEFIAEIVGAPAHLVGWSDGGIVALLVAIVRPDLVRKVVAAAANFKPGLEIGMGEMLEEMTPDNPEFGMFKAMYEAATPDGADHWPVVLGKLRDLYASAEPDISDDDLGSISAPTLVMSGDDDVIPLEHTVALYRAIPRSELVVVPGTSHALFMEKSPLVNRIILDFVDNDPVPTILPVRRAQAATIS